MRKVILFIAMSLDGYIADCEGKVDWLEGQGNEEEMIDTYSEFVTQVDTVVMGFNTYHQIVTELSPDEWVYQGLNSYVITHRKPASAKGIQFSAEDPCELINTLKKEDGKGIRLFDSTDRKIPLKIVKTQSYNGITDLVYERRE